MERVRTLARRATGVCIVASLFLLTPAVAGVSASVLLTVGLAGGGLVCVSVRSRLQDVPAIGGVHPGRYAQDLWLSLFLAAAVLVAFPGATADELQTLGGVTGFVGMVNYFVTPVYLFVYSQVARLGGRQRRTRDERL